MSGKKKILFAAQNLRLGGVQTSLINLLNELSKCEEYEVDLFTFGKGELLNKIPANINISYGTKELTLVATPFSEVIRSKNIIDICIRIFMMIFVRVIGSQKFYRTLFKRCQTDKQYNTAVSYFNDVPKNYFNQGTNLYVDEFVNARKKIAWVHTDPIFSSFDKEYCRKIYRNFNKIICVSKAVKQKMDMLLPEYADKTEVVYNKFNEEEIKRMSLEYDVSFDRQKLNIVTVARVDNVSKRIDKIIDFCDRLKNDGVSDFCWRIVGDGPDFISNQKKAKQLMLEDLIVFEGEKENPYPYIKNSDLFVLYSAYEGFPMVVGEALILNVFVLTSEYAAAYEQIPDNKGYIAKSDEEFYKRLKQYIKNKKFRRG